MAYRALRLLAVSPQAAGGHDMVSSGSEEEGEDARDTTKSAAQNGSNILAKARNIFGQFFLMVL